MYFKQSVILLLATIPLLVNSASSVSEDNINFSLLSLMARSNDLMQRNSLRSTECFDYYIPLIDHIAKTYQHNLDTCLQAARIGHSEAETATLDKRNALAVSASSSCLLLSQCSEISSAEEVFKCYAVGGAANTKTMYKININAAEHLSDLQEEFRLVENREYKCTNDTKRQYEKDSSKAYEDFNKCVLAIIDVPNTTEAPAEPTTTENPESTESTATTQQSTQASIEPETTQEPEISASTPIPVVTTSTETTEAPEEVNPESKLPEEDLSFRR